MSKDFDTTLSDALDLAAHAAHGAGPAAARSRGRKRAIRQRVALSTASLVIVAVGATAVFEAASGHGGNPRPVSASPRISVSASGGPSAAPTQSASSTPATTSPSHSAPGSSPAGSSAPASSGPSVGDPQKVVAGAWLPASGLPFDSTFQWKAATSNPQGSSPLGQPLSPTVFYVPSDTGLQSLTMCADPAQLLPRTIGAQHTDYGATAGSGNNQASQFVFFFKDDVAAQETYKWLQNQYAPSSCLLKGTGAQVTETAGDANSATWLTVPGSAGTSDLPKYAREYFVLRGSTIAYVYVMSYTTTLSPTYDDTKELSTIDSHMCVYGGACG